MANILVIDDDEALRGLLLAMLKATGHTAIASTNGLDGLKHFRTAPADLVITDMVMPYSGLATIRMIRKEFPDVGIIAMTGGGEFRLDYAVGTGAHATLRKPFLVEDLTGRHRRSDGGPRVCEAQTIAPGQCPPGSRKKSCRRRSVAGLSIGLP